MTFNPKLSVSDGLDHLLRPTVGEVPLSRRLRSVPRVHTADGNASA